VEGAELVTDDPETVPVTIPTVCAACRMMMINGSLPNMTRRLPSVEASQLCCCWFNQQTVLSTACSAGQLAGYRSVWP